MKIKKGNDVVSIRIKELCSNLNINSNKELSEKTKLTEQKISDILEKRERRTIDNMVLIAKSLDCSIDYLYGLSDVASLDLTIKDISTMTGLNESSIKKLYVLNKNKDNRLNLINEMLSSKYFKERTRSP